MKGHCSSSVQMGYRHSDYSSYAVQFSPPSYLQSNPSHEAPIYSLFESHKELYLFVLGIILVLGLYPPSV